LVQVHSNGLSIEVEQYGNMEGPPLLLIPGYGAQLISWPKGMIDQLTGSGFFVIAMDNRDVGLSEKLVSAGVPDIAALRSLAQVTPDVVPYTLSDMADDAAGVIEAFGIGAAHVVGKSMGGLIAQALCARHSHKVSGLSLLITTSAASSLPPMRQEIELLLFGAGADNIAADRDVMLDAAVEAEKAWASPAYPLDPAERRARALAAYERSHDPDGVSRQAAALLCALRGRSEPHHLDVPALIVQGKADTIFPTEHGQDLAQRIAGAELLEVEGMGHDLEGGATDIVTSAIIRRVKSVEDLTRRST